MKFLMIVPLFLCVLASASTSRADGGILALCYHDVRYDVLSRVDRDGTALSVRKLGEHFSWLRENGYTPVSLEKLLAAERGETTLPEKPVLLTFDDGYTSFYTRIYPLLKEFDYPAVFALVTSWLEVPDNEQVVYGDELRPREDFLTWEQVREMTASGLIEIASHTHDMHRAHASNPHGSLRPVASSVAYDSSGNRYESLASYRQRVQADLQLSVDLIKQRAGVDVKAIAWPYGSYTPEASRLAAAAGLTINLTLDNGTARQGSSRNIPRVLVGGNPSVKEMAWSLNFVDEPDVHKGLFVSLKEVWDDDQEQLYKNVSALLDNVKLIDPTHVYLSIADDLDDDGQYDVAWFPNNYLKTKGDILDWVSWALKTRAGVEVLIWVDPERMGSAGTRVQQREFLSHAGVFSGTRGVITDNTLSFDELLDPTGLFAGYLHYTKSPWKGRVVDEEHAATIADPTQESAQEPLLTIIRLAGREIPRDLLSKHTTKTNSVTERNPTGWNQVIFTIPEGKKDVRAFERQVNRMRAIGARNLAIYRINPGKAEPLSPWFRAIRHAVSASINPYER